MKRWLIGAILVGGCGTHLSARDARRLQTALGVSASELAVAAEAPRLQAIASDLKANDPATQRLGQAECILLQTRAQTLGRETAAALRLLPGQDPDQIDRVSADLQGAVLCLPGEPFIPGPIGKALRNDVSQVQQAVQKAQRP